VESSRTTAASLAVFAMRAVSAATRTTPVTYCAEALRGASSAKNAATTAAVMRLDLDDDTAAIRLAPGQVESATRSYFLFFLRRDT
jgi:hypothetical protein